MASSHQHDFGLVFIPVNVLGKPKGVTHRKLVRSRCIRGRNMRIRVPGRNLCEEAQKPPKPPLRAGPAQTPCSGVSPYGAAASRTQYTASDRETNQKATWPSYVTSPLCPSEVPLIHLAFHVDHDSRKLLFNCTSDCNLGSIAPLTTIYSHERHQGMDVPRGTLRGL